MNNALLPLYRGAIEQGLAKTLPSLTIETTNICNANCTFCGYQFQERPTGAMSMTLYQKVIDEFVQCGGKFVLVSGTVGDPLVDKLLLERISYARERGVPEVGMFSNLISLRRHGAAELVQSGLAKLVVSISGLDAAMYERVYRSTQYSKVLANLHSIIDANEAAGSPIDIRLAMRADRPLREVRAYPDLIEIERRLGPGRIDYNYYFDDWSGRIKQRDLTGTMKIRPGWLRPKLSPCVELFSGLMIYWDGKVGACGCRDLEAKELIVGDVTRNHLAEIWFGEPLRRLREEFMTPARKEICSTCKHYNGLTMYLAPAARKKWQDPLDSRALWQESAGTERGPRRRLPLA
ncbi:MAG: radical SAM protein [Polyangiaceae bacterium]